MFLTLSLEKGNIQDFPTKSSLEEIFDPYIIFFRHGDRVSLGRATPLG